MQPALTLPASWRQERSALLKLTAAFIAVSLAWLWLRPANDLTVQAVTSVFATGAPLIGLIWSLGSFRMLKPWLSWSTAGRSLPVDLIASKSLRSLRLANFSSTLGMIATAVIYTVTVQIQHQQVPFPTWNDVFFFGALVFWTLSIWQLPIGPTSPAVRIRVFIDSLMIVAAALAFGWYFLFGELLAQPDETLFSKIAQFAYPLGNLFALVLCLALSNRVEDIRVRKSLNVNTVLIAIAAVSNTVIHYQRLHHTFLISQPWNVTVIVIMIGLGLAAKPLMMTVESFTDELANWQAGGTGGERVSPTWRVILPYAFLPAVGLLVLGTWHSSTYLRMGVWIGGAVLVGLVMFRQIFALIENQRLYRQIDNQNATLLDVNTKLAALATTDPITELPNHRAMVAILDSELQRALRHNRPCAVIFLDIDHFKALNDTWGHRIGDETLHAVSACIKDTLREVDVVGRWGGEEFLVVLPDTDPDGAQIVAERVRSTVASLKLSETNNLHVTCSLGVAVYPQHSTDRDDLIAAADRAMYGAKTLGRNQARMVDDPLVVASTEATSQLHSREHTGLVSLVETLAALLAAGNSYAGEHGRAVAALALDVSVAMHVADDERQLVKLAALLHDVGKIGLPVEIIQKFTPLTDQEWLLVREHPSIGADVVERTAALHPLAPLIRAHHERWDGSGYPRNLSGADIPLGARIISVVDAYMAMTEERSYRTASSSADAILELKSLSGKQFDPDVVRAMVSVIKRLKPVA